MMLSFEFVKKGGKGSGKYFVWASARLGKGFSVQFVLFSSLVAHAPV